MVKMFFMEIIDVFSRGHGIVKLNVVHILTVIFSTGHNISQTCVICKHLWESQNMFA